MRVRLGTTKLYDNPTVKCNLPSLDHLESILGFYFWHLHSKPVGGNNMFIVVALITWYNAHLHLGL